MVTETAPPPPIIETTQYINFLDTVKWAAPLLNVQADNWNAPHDVLWKQLFHEWSMPSNDTLIWWSIEPYDINNWDEENNCWKPEVNGIHDQFNQLLMKHFNFLIGHTFAFYVSW
jgi:hypothetical protein